MEKYAWLVVLTLAQIIQFLIVRRNGKKGNPGNFNNGLKKLEEKLEKRMDKGFDEIRLEAREKNKTCVEHGNKLGKLDTKIEFIREDIKEIKKEMKRE